MKNLIISVVVLFATQPLLAQSNSNPQASASTTSISNIMSGAGAVKGIQVELTKPILDIKLSGSGESDKANMEDVFGFSLGYKNIAVGQLGFIGGATFLTGDVEEIPGSWNFLKLDGNAAFGLNDLVHLKGGLNISQLLSGPGNVDDLIDSPGIGFQFGAGLQINQNVSLDLKYVAMKQEGKVNGVSVDLEEKGLEFGIGATF